MDLIRQEAVKFLHQIREKYGQPLGSTYQGWKKHYQNLVKCTWYFIFGYRKYTVGQYELALVHMIQALRLHKLISETNPTGVAKTLDYKVLGFCHRKCLHMLNSKLVQSFLAVDTEAKALEVAQTVSKLIVPALWYAMNSNNEEDLMTGESVRYRWCQTIGKVSENKSLLIKQIIEILTNEGCESLKLPLKIPSIPPVLSLYKEYKDTVAGLALEKDDTQTSDL